MKYVLLLLHYQPYVIPQEISLNDTSILEKKLPLRIQVAEIWVNQRNTSPSEYQYKKKSCLLKLLNQFLLLQWQVIKI